MFLSGADPTTHGLLGEDATPGGSNLPPPSEQNYLARASAAQQRSAGGTVNSADGDDGGNPFEPELIIQPKKKKGDVLRKLADSLDTLPGKITVAIIIAFSTFCLLIESQAEGNMVTPEFDRLCRALDLTFGVIFFIEWIMRCTSAGLKSKAKFAAYIISFTGICDFLGSFFWPYLFSGGEYGRMDTLPFGHGITYMYRAFKLARFYSICCPGAARGLWRQYWKGAWKPLFSLMACFIIVWILLACALYNMEKSALANDTRRVFPTLQNKKFSERLLDNGEINPDYISDSWIFVCSRRFYLQILPAMSFETMAFRRSGHTVDTHMYNGDSHDYKPMSVAQSLGTSRKVLEFQRLLHQQAWKKLSEDQNWLQFIKADLDKTTYNTAMLEGPRKNNLVMIH